MVLLEWLVLELDVVGLLLDKVLDWLLLEDEAGLPLEVLT